MAAGKVRLFQDDVAKSHPKVTPFARTLRCVQILNFEVKLKIAPDLIKIRVPALAPRPPTTVRNMPTKAKVLLSPSHSTIFSW